MQNVMVSVQKLGCVNMKLKSRPKVSKKRSPRGSKKPEKGGKFKPKEINIAALKSNIRQTTPGYGCCYCRGGLVNTGRGLRKRVFRKESLYISR